MIKGKKICSSLLVMVVSLLVISGSVWAAGNTPNDVPAAHWAYQSVKLLLDKGYLQLYQDDTFRGNQPVDRYTLATVVAKILKEAGSGAVATSREDVKLLRSLSNEFREELVKVLTNNSSLSKKLEELARQDQIFKEDLTTTNASVQNLSMEQTELQTEVQQIIADVLVLKKKVEQLEGNVATLNEQVAQLKVENKKQNMYLVFAIIVGLAGVAN